MKRKPQKDNRIYQKSVYLSSLAEEERKPGQVVQFASGKCYTVIRIDNEMAYFHPKLPDQVETGKA